MLIRLLSLAIVCLMLGALSAPAEAQQMVYTPRNPAFGGNPMNHQWLMQSAQAQNDHTETRQNARDPLQNFQDGLQRQILSALSRELITTRFRDMDLSQAGKYDFGDFIVDIIPGMDGITIHIFNVLTGDESVITVPHY